jgi:hypothetical protein
VKVRVTGWSKEGAQIELQGVCLSSDQHKRIYPLDTILMVSWRESANAWGSAGYYPQVVLAEGGNPEWREINPAILSRIQEVPASQYPYYLKELLAEAPKAKGKKVAAVSV